MRIRIRPIVKAGRKLRCLRVASDGGSPGELKKLLPGSKHLEICRSVRRTFRSGLEFEPGVRVKRLSEQKLCRLDVVHLAFVHTGSVNVLAVDDPAN